MIRPRKDHTKRSRVKSACLWTSFLIALSIWLFSIEASLKVRFPSGLTLTTLDGSIVASLYSNQYYKERPYIWNYNPKSIKTSFERSTERSIDFIPSGTFQGLLTRWSITVPLWWLPTILLIAAVRYQAKNSDWRTLLLNPKPTRWISRVASAITIMLLASMILSAWIQFHIGGTHFPWWPKMGLSFRHGVLYTTDLDGANFVNGSIMFSHNSFETQLFYRIRNDQNLPAPAKLIWSFSRVPTPQFSTILLWKLVLYSGLTALLFALISKALTARYARLPQFWMTCPKCFYNRTGLAPGAVCPECGSQPIIPSKSKPVTHTTSPLPPQPDQPS